MVSVDVSLRSEKRITVHCPELILHIMKSRDQTSVLLSVGCLHLGNEYVISVKSNAILSSASNSKEYLSKLHMTHIRIENQIIHST